MTDRMKNVLLFLLKELVLFLIGGFIYAMIEIIGRGFTHWSMFIVGGIAFIIIGLINEWYTWNIPFIVQMAIGAFVITALELISGYIVNIRLGWDVWDYTDRFMNLGGQICLFNTIYWVILSGVGIVLDDCLRWKLFGDEKPRYILIHKKLI